MEIFINNLLLILLLIYIYFAAGHRSSYTDIGYLMQENTCLSIILALKLIKYCYSETKDEMVVVRCFVFREGSPTL